MDAVREVGRETGKQQMMEIEKHSGQVNGHGTLWKESECQRKKGREKLKQLPFH